MNMCRKEEERLMCVNEKGNGGREKERDNFVCVYLCTGKRQDQWIVSYKPTTIKIQQKHCNTNISLCLQTLLQNYNTYFLVCPGKYLIYLLSCKERYLIVSGKIHLNIIRIYIYRLK